MIVNRSSVVCVAGVLANKSSSVSSAMWSTVFSLAAESSEQDREISKKICFNRCFVKANIDDTYACPLQLKYI